MNFNEKQIMISKITDEVNDLHPLLNDVFRKMDGVLDVEYTHGSNEKGADFIITKNDHTLNRSHHVGVIVKVGKITSDITDISRQIEECQMPRKINGGKNVTGLSEVWVVNNSTISSLAKDKINHLYSTQRVEFITGENLVALVDKNASYFWHQISIDIGKYLRDLSNKLELQEKEYSVLNGLGCEDFYISPEIQEFEKTQYVKNKRPSRPRYVNILDEALRNRVSFLEGEMGFGKSKTARYIANYFCAPEKFKQNQVIPVFDTFRKLFENQTSLNNLLKETTNSFFELINQNSDYKILFILDGLDESNTKTQEWKTYLNDLIQESKASVNFHLLITTRPLRRLEESVTIYSGTKSYILKPLSLSKLISFIEKACEKLSIPRRLFEDLQKSDLFKQLPQSPIAAALLSRLIAQNSNDLPSNLTELYSKSIENLLGRWDMSKGGCTEREFKDAEYVSMDIAEYMVANKLIYLSESEAKQRICTWYRERNTPTKLEALIDRVIEKSGLFALDNENEVITFRHRSFGEYLYALNCCKKHKLLPIDFSFEPYWVTVQFFQTGILGDCKDHLLSLLTYKPKSEIESWLKTISMPDYFLAGSQTPYSVVEDNLFNLFIDAAILFEKTKNGSTETKLSELPEMHLLWFFQRLIRSSFEYEYFRKAISSTILKIDQEILPDEVKFTSLFFAACYAAELNDPAGFEYLIKNYGADKLPITISLAINLEQNCNKNFSKLPLLKEHEKKLNKILKPTGEHKHVNAINQLITIKDLFEKPVRVSSQSQHKS